MTRKTIADYDPRVLDLFDRFVHGEISRRGFLDRAGAFLLAGASASAVLESLTPDFVSARQVPEDDPRLLVSELSYPSPAGSEKTRGYLAAPAAAAAPLPGIVVIHENRGLNPHIEDITRRLALEGYLAFAPDALAPLGGYPGTEDAARTLFRELDRQRTSADFVAASRFLMAHAQCTGAIGSIGFCFGGGVANQLAIDVPEMRAAVPFYGRPASPDDVEAIKAPIQFHFAGLDQRINAAWPALKVALEESGKPFEAYIYDGASHGFNNDTTPRFDATAAALAWDRALEFFGRHLS